MKNRLCVLLALAPFPVVAEEPATRAFQEVRIETGPFSIVGERPGASTPAGFPLPASGDVQILGKEDSFGPPAERTPDRPRTLSEAMAHQFRYDPGAYRGTGPWAPVSDLVTMSPYHVIDRRERDAAEAIDATVGEGDFRMETGGRLLSVPLGPMKVDVGIWHPDNVTEDKFPMIGWELVRIHW